MINSEDFEKLHKLPEERAELNYDRTFREEEFNVLSKGLVAEDMDSKWNAVMHESILYLYRSWTGNCIYSVELLKTDEGYRTKETLVNRNQEQYKSEDNAYDALLLDFFISNLILGESKPFPNKGNGDEPEGLIQHSLSGTAYKEVMVSPKKIWWKFW